jgi:hypothetical protein
MHRCDAQPQIPMVGQNRRTLKRDVDHHDDPLPKDDAVQRAFSQTFGSNCSRQFRTFHTSMHPAVDPSSGACCCLETDVAITHVDFLSTWQVARANVLARSTHQRRFACDARRRIRRISFHSHPTPLLEFFECGSENRRSSSHTPALLRLDSTGTGTEKNSKHCWTPLYFSCVFSLERLCYFISIFIQLYALPLCSLISVCSTSTLL